MPSDLVLGFDTSGPWVQAALVQGDTVLGHVDLTMAKGQAETLMPALDTLLRDCGVAWAELDGLGTGTGPGNFTGVRLSVAAARGLALGLGIPAIGVTGFDALALDGPPLPVILPALRGQVWVRAPGQPPALADTPPHPAIGAGLTPPAHPLPVAIARLAAARLRQPNPRPAPLYLREADAAPPREAPPALIA